LTIKQLFHCTVRGNGCDGGGDNDDDDDDDDDDRVSFIGEIMENI
jgi:hypothetical protein